MMCRSDGHIVRICRFVLDSSTYSWNVSISSTCHQWYVAIPPQNRQVGLVVRLLLGEQFTEAERLEATIRKKLEVPGYGR